MTIMCLACELFNCVDCDSYDAMPEYGCCCGRIGSDQDEMGDGQDWPDDIDDREVTNGG